MGNLRNKKRRLEGRGRACWESGILCGGSAAFAFDIEMVARGLVMYAVDEG